MINWKRLVALIALVVVASGGLYTYLMRQEEARNREARLAWVATPPPRPPRPWRWATEPEWVVHEVTRHIASWVAFARNEDPTATRISVRRADRKFETVGTFEVVLRTAGASRTVTIRPGKHVWDPLAYVELTRELAGAGAGATGGEPAARVEGLLLVGDTSSLRQADAALWAEMSRRPGDPRLHEQAALLWASHGLRESDSSSGDERPFLNGVTAHLALASALRAGAEPSTDARIAAAALDALLLCQVEAMAALDALAAEAASPAWTAALRLRVTVDPRGVASSPRASRLEKVEGLRAIRSAVTCRAAVAQAHAWRLPPAADWVRSTVRTCSEPELAELSRRYMELQAADAAVLLDERNTDVETLLSLEEQAAAENTHQPTRPVHVIPRYLRGEAGQRHLVSAFYLGLQEVNRRGVQQEIQMFALATGSLRERLPLGPFLEMAVGAASRREPREYPPPRETCEQVARLVAERPDLVLEGSWGSVGPCQKQSLLQMVDSGDWNRSVVTPGTARLGTAPWQTGPTATGPTIEGAHGRAPWSAAIASRLLLVKYHGATPPAAVLAAYEKVLDYDVGAMVGAVFHLHGADDEAVRLSERICEIDPEQCGAYAAYVARLGRPEPAERMWKRGLASTRDLITLSNRLAGYVGLLLDRGDTAEALRVARLAADVYSAEGLRTLGYAYERLGRVEEAAREYALITERYDNKMVENEFYVRYRQRHADERFSEESARAMAEVFPNGLRRKSLADFQRDRHRGGVLLDLGNLSEGLRRLGLASGDFLVGVDGYAVESRAQMDAVLTFTDEQQIAIIFLRKGGEFAEVAGPEFRTRFGPPPPARRKGA